MEKLLEEALNTSKLTVLGQFGGCIAKDAAGYEIDGGKRIFVKSGVSNASQHLQGARACFLCGLHVPNRQSNLLKENSPVYKQCNGPIQLEYQIPLKCVAHYNHLKY